ncbi:phage portal protein [Acetobacterium sp. KB-1]|jgi:HK97 family phage portal protein|uniref:phage portal protein n=1 Tax=Acetobacterium sp. KB-1 TaxID=2184575 RepID=UPI000DBEB8AB|nr:phage portal protein [Acetobacterium sp. KB-1]AWW25956.1 phage portal protein [Acetobacterium sp. KB-1]
MSRLRDLFHSRDKPKNYLDNNPFSFFFGGTTAGKNVNERTAMQTTAVYSCVRILAETIASLPLHTFEYTDVGKQKAMNHPLYQLLYNEPNPEMTSFVFRETLMSHLLLWGNAYAQIIRNGRGQVMGLYPLLPSKMTVDRAVNGELFYKYQSDKGEVVLAKEMVLHIPGLGFDGLIGYSPIAMAKNAIGMAIATEEYGSSFFANGANPGGVLEHPGVVKDPKRVRESWNAVYQGSGNAHRIAVLEEGMRFTPIGIPPEQAQFLETRKFQLNEIARIFRIPPHMIGDLEKSSFSNIEQQSLEFVKYTLDPWVIRWEQSMQKALLSETDKQKYFIRFSVDGLLRGDYESRMAGYATGRQNGWLSANDIRELENLNHIPEELGGDLYLINGAMTKLQDAGAFANTESEETNEEILELD